MAAALHALGAIEHWVRPAGLNTFLYLGTAVTSPLIRSVENFRPIINDLGGRSVEIDKVRDRRKSTIVTTLNRLNWSTYNTIRRMRAGGDPNAAIVTGASTNTTFVEGLLDHAIPVIGRSDFELLLQFTLGPTGSGVADTPYGRLYYGCTPMGWEENSAETEVVDLTLQIESIGKFFPTSRHFLKWTEDPTAWGTLTPE